MSLPATSRHQAATAHAVATPAPLTDADSPLLAGTENHVRNLALLLLRLSADITLLRALFLALIAPLLVRCRREASGPWYLSSSDQDGIDAMSPRGQRAARRLLAFIGWALAGHRRRGMRRHARPAGGAAPSLHPNRGPRAPPCPG